MRIKSQLIIVSPDFRELFTSIQLNLRRRSLLKRLLFLFASAPGKVFSKEAIVQAVWNVDYHPLRHDAALFTNIMRIRRLLGEDGSEIIRVTEDGYRFVPPRDFLFVIPR